MTTTIKASDLNLEKAKELEGSNAILLATPGSVPQLLVEAGEEGVNIDLDVELAFYTGGGFQPFQFETLAFLQGDLRVSHDEEHGTYVFAFVCDPFTKEDGSDVILLNTNADLQPAGEE